MTPLPQTADIIGPFSPWPRRPARRRTRTRLALGAGVAAAAVFAHCVAPLL